jgi:hypothetical protein
MHAVSDSQETEADDEVKYKANIIEIKIAVPSSFQNAEDSHNLYKNIFWLEPYGADFMAWVRLRL